MTTLPERIEITGPWITQREIDYVTEAARTNWFGRANDFIRRFEAAFAHHTGRRHAIATSSCTHAIHLALASLGVGPGDEVIVPELTWIATAAPVIYLGATPVFADVDPVNWCLDPASVERALSPRTKAVITVDLYGTFAPMEKLQALADVHGFALIEDAAQTVGALYRGRPAGSFGRASTFSFHGSKTITTGEGGMFLTDDTALYERALVLGDHGRMPQDRALFNREIGYKMKMSSMAAAMGLAQLERLPEIIAAKRQHFAWYRARLEGIPEVKFNRETEGVFHSYWMTNVLAAPESGFTKERLIEVFQAQNVVLRPMFYPLSQLPAFAAHPSARGCVERNPVSYAVSHWGVNLPSGFHLDEAKVDRVCRLLQSTLRQ